MPKKIFVLYRMPASIKHKTMLYMPETPLNQDDFLPIQRGEIEGSDDIDMLDKLFDAFNEFNVPELIHNFVGNSMSSGDVIALLHIKTGEPIFYLCCTLGWHRLEGWS